MRAKFHFVTEAKPVFISRFEAVPDATKPGFYAGVLIIEKGFAKGHYAVKDGTMLVNYDPTDPAHAELQKYPIHITDATLADVVTCGNAEGDAKCKLDHGSSVMSIVGNYSNFRQENNSVRADLTLDQDAQYKAHAQSLIKNFSKKIGNSIDFDYSYEIDGAVAVARCRKLNSVDIVDSPAATNSLFDQPNNNTHMPLNAEDLKAIGDLVDTKLSTLDTKLNAKFAAMDDKVSKMEEGDDDDDKKKKEKADKEEDKTGLSAKEIGDIAGKAALAAVESVFPKAKREQLSSLADPKAGDNKTEFEKLVDVQLAAGAPSKGIAIQRAAKDNKAAFNAHMQKQNATL